MQRDITTVALMAPTMSNKAEIDLQSYLELGLKGRPLPPLDHPEGWAVPKGCSSSSPQHPQQVWSGSGMGVGEEATGSSARLSSSLGSNNHTLIPCSDSSRLLALKFPAPTLACAEACRR